MFFRKKINTPLVITIPNPCSEDWNRMHVVNDQQRHCTSCERTLTDFSLMSDDELVLFFRHNNGKICGRFTSHQLNRSLGKVPDETIPARWWKAAALLPLTLFGKNLFAQQQDSVAVPDSTQQVNVDSIAADSLADVVVNDTDNTVIDEVVTVALLPPPNADPIIPEVIFLGGIVASSGYMPMGWTPIAGSVQNPETPGLTSRWHESTPFNWFRFRSKKRQDHTITPSNPNNVATEQPKPKEEPKVPPVPAAPWYEAILPSAIRIRKKS